MIALAAAILAGILSTAYDKAAIYGAISAAGVTLLNFVIAALLRPGFQISNPSIGEHVFLLMIITAAGLLISTAAFALKKALKGSKAP